MDGGRESFTLAIGLTRALSIGPHRPAAPIAHGLLSWPRPIRRDNPLTAHLAAGDYFVGQSAVRRSVDRGIPGQRGERMSSIAGVLAFSPSSRTATSRRWIHSTCVCAAGSAA